MTDTDNTMPALIYFSRSNIPSGRPHQHSFYQIEYCLSGRLFCNCQDKLTVLPAGHYCLLPPALPHQFLPRPDPYEYLSLKFNWDQSLPFATGADSIVVHLLNDILQLSSSSSPLSPFSSEGKFVIETHLHGVLMRLQNMGTRPPESAFLGKLREFIVTSGYEVDVAILAHCFHCSRTQFYRMFKEECRDMTTKEFIDDILLDMAQRHLNYSGMNVSTIARELHFPSVYAFSRFFKRMTGESPLEYRNRFN